MSTWSELRQEILYMLDKKPNASTADDTRNTIDIKLKRKRDEIYDLRPPRSLLVYSSVVSVPSTLDYIKIEGAAGGANQPSFALTDYWKPYGLAIGASDSTQDEEEIWEFIEYDTWVRSNSSIEGNQRLSRTFTIDYQGFIHLRDLPGTGETWNARLYYYKQPTTIIDGGTPEIGAGHERVIVLGVVLEFPHLFRGEERAAIYASMLREYEMAKKHYLQSRTVGGLMTRLRPFMKRAGRGVLTIWGDPS